MERKRIETFALHLLDNPFLFFRLGISQFGGVFGLLTTFVH